MKYDYLVVGAGLFGSVFAHEMTEKGYKCLVIDKRDHLAGNVYTRREHGIDVHVYGPHIFHTSDPEIWEYVNNITEFNGFINSPIACYEGERYNLPFNMNTFEQMWGVTEPIEARKIIAEQIEALNIAQPANLEEQALSLVGVDVYTKLVKGYTEKQWGRDCKDLPASIIKRLPVRFTYDNNYYNDPFQGIPVNGFTEIVEKLLDGIEVRLNTPYAKLVNAAAKEGISWEKILYTGPIDEYFNYSLGHLEYRTLKFATEYLPDIDDYQGNAVINYTERKVPYTRIMEHKHFAFNKCHGTIITREYPAEWIEGAEPYYAINDAKNNALYEGYAELAKKDPKVIFGGRLGRYKYYDMDKSIKEALELARKLSAK